MLKDAAGSDCGDIVREIIAIVNEAARWVSSRRETGEISGNDRCPQIGPKSAYNLNEVIPRDIG